MEFAGSHILSVSQFEREYVERIFVPVLVLEVVAAVDKHSREVNWYTAGRC